MTPKKRKAQTCENNTSFPLTTQQVYSFRPQKPCFVVFSRSLVHGGEGYPEPNERLHAYAEVLPPGVYLPHTFLWAGRNAPFLLADSREEVQHLERLDLAFNLARRGAFGGTQINVITVSDDDDEEDQPH